MSEDRSWGADTVAFGRAPRKPHRPEPPRRHPTRPRRPTIALSLAALVAVAIVGVVVLIAGAGGESDSGEASIREASNPIPRVVVRPARKVPPQGRRRDLREPTDRYVREVEVNKREAAAGAETQAEDGYEPAAEVAPEYAPPPAPEPPPAPTSPSTEFGL